MESQYTSIFELTRGDVVESIHYGSVAITTSQNKLLAWYGNPHVITFLRSTAKPFQALSFFENGGKQFYELTQEEVAIVCASHSGTNDHKRVVESIQAKSGVQEQDLLCGVHSPMHRLTAEALAKRGEQPTPNRHNCSGKHTGMLAYARMRQLPYSLETQPYIDPQHPIQQDILQVFADMCGLLPANVHVGIDGCSAPNFAVPLQNAAYAYARLCDPSGLQEPRAQACQMIVQAMMAYPQMVGGPGAFDTELMDVMQGKVVSKGGAEGYQGMGIMPGILGADSPGIGIAFKISDGDYRNQARSAVALEILRQLGAISNGELKKLEDFGPQLTLLNFRKLQVGQGRPAFRLNQ